MMVALDEGVELADRWSGLDEVLPLLEVVASDGSVVALSFPDNEADEISVHIARSSDGLHLQASDRSLEEVLVPTLLQYFPHPRPPLRDLLQFREAPGNDVFAQWWPRVKGRGFFLKLDGERRPRARRYTVAVRLPLPHRMDHFTLGQALETLFEHLARGPEPS